MHGYYDQFSKLEPGENISSKELSKLYSQNHIIERQFV
jgi:hypothetical protein